MVMDRALSSLAVAFLEFFAIASILHNEFCIGSPRILCMGSERQALLSLKNDMNDPSNLLSTWIDETDCCGWTGVVCDNLTGHVLELHLRPQARSEALSGSINPSLLNLKHLSYLDLSYNDFGGIQIPTFLGSLGSLRYLNLSEAGFGRMIPHQLGNLSGLRYLNLQNSFWGETPLYADSLQWLTTLSFLEYLDLSQVNLHNAIDWVQAVNMLCSLIELHLQSCDLHQIPDLHYVNLSSLAVLDLSKNSFNSLPAPRWVFELTNLVSLNINQCYFQLGPIPSGLQNMTSLRNLDLSANSFNSSIPEGLYSLSQLEYLNLGYNNLHGSLSNTVGNLTSLVTLDLSSNKLEGEVPKSLGELCCNLAVLALSEFQVNQEISKVLGNLSGCILDGLMLLDLSYTQLSGLLIDVIDQFVQMKNLSHLSLRGNSISGSIPESFGDVTSLRVLDLSHNLLNGTLPESLGQLARLEELKLANNSFHGLVSEVHLCNLTRLSTLAASGNELILNVSSKWVPDFQLETMELNSWRLGPQFPMWICSQMNLEFIDISHTGISDTMPTCFWNISSFLYYLNVSHNQFQGLLPKLSSNVYTLDLSNNLFSGNISRLLCNRMGERSALAFLFLQNNLLSGKIPECWTHWPMLEVINLGNNNLTGYVPTSLGSLRNLQSLHLRKNSLSGELPLSLQNCTLLLIIDLGRNKFIGSLPTWLGKFSYLSILSINSNKFRGTIPYEFCHLNSLQVLDLAHNNLSGAIPRCFNNFSAMTMQHQLYPFWHITSIGRRLSENALLVMKGREFEYSTTLNLVMSIDLSDNSLSGEIPQELTSLHSLESLNLSNNLFTGRIPKKIGDIRFLESLDFSRNQLSGEIPASISSLTFLNDLNLSYNKLMGKIPSSTQLQSLDATSFIGNKLCGPPLTDNCSINTVKPNPASGGSSESDIFKEPWLYLSAAVGFVVGFWGVMGPLLVNRSWRFAYFRCLDNIGNKIFQYYLYIYLGLGKLREKFLARL
ncbi:receptor-like protein EIX1 [Malania oleifera]|uniref:receptor-like protein EIX1 n=1 Tax=Malania oleifera TaxID=397392 RepID=UPI0025AE2233|nr:receptor-like protein EIX1 [Malania oleifera]